MTERTYVREFEDGGQRYKCVHVFDEQNITTRWEPKYPPATAPGTDYYLWRDSIVADFARATGVHHRIVAEAPHLGFRMREEPSPEKRFVIDYNGHDFLGVYEYFAALGRDAATLRDALQELQTRGPWNDDTASRIQAQDRLIENLHTILATILVVWPAGGDQKKPS